MAQLPLFDPGPQRMLLDDPTGRIEYMPAWVDAGQAGNWFAALLQEIPWRAQRRLMYDTEVDVPRLLGHYRLDGDPLPPALQAIASRVLARGLAPFDSVGLNLYRDEHDSVAPHNDRLHELEPGHPVLLVSLGATRQMVIRAKQPPRRLLTVDLEAGSLLTMSYATQLNFDHGIPKQRERCGPRISLAFRVRPVKAVRSGVAPAESAPRSKPTS
jgi:alkylated DNA repair dioxygenase AlkB